MLLIGMTASILGYSLFQVGIIARNVHGLRNGIEKSILENLTYDRGMIIAGLLCIIGFALDLHFLTDYIANSFIIGDLSRSAIFGLLLIILGVQTVSFTLLLELRRRLGQSCI